MYRIHATRELEKAMQKGMADLRNQHLNAAVFAEMGNAERETYMKEKKAIENEMEALVTMAQSYRELDATTDSLVNQCSKPVDIVLPWDGPVKEMAAPSYDKCIHHEENDVFLSKEVSSFDDLFHFCIANQLLD
ncbi:hypothetical protein E2P81_ATG00503 [Venturia nashicola]|nr:hypothetical protein E2P81_ATG00503 [Venturia nashicola]